MDQNMTPELENEKSDHSTAEENSSMINRKTYMDVSYDIDIDDKHVTDTDTGNDNKHVSDTDTGNDDKHVTDTDTGIDEKHATDTDTGNDDKHVTDTGNDDKHVSNTDTGNNDKHVTHTDTGNDDKHATDTDTGNDDKHLTVTENDDKHVTDTGNDDKQVTGTYRGNDDKHVTDTDKGNDDKHVTDTDTGNDDKQVTGTNRGNDDKHVTDTDKGNDDKHVTDTDTGNDDKHVTDTENDDKHVTDTDTGNDDKHVTDTDTGNDDKHVTDTDTGNDDKNVTDTGNYDKYVSNTDTGNNDKNVTDTDTGNDEKQVTDTGNYDKQVTDTGNNDKHVTDTDTGNNDKHVTDTDTGNDDKHVTDTDTGNDDKHVTDTDTENDDKHVTDTDTGNVDKHLTDLDTGNDDKHESDTDTGNISGTSRSCKSEFEMEKNTSCNHGDDPLDSAAANNKSLQKEAEKALGRDELVKGTGAMKHYHLYKSIENKIRISALEETRENVKRNHEWKLARLADIEDKARAYYTHPKDADSSREWKEMRRTVSSHRHKGIIDKSNTHLRFHLSSLHEYTPVLTYLYILVYVATVSVLCAFGGLEEVGMEPKVKVRSGVKTFLGIETVDKWSAPNMWAGPPQRFLISVGAVFAPCMRTDIAYQIRTASLNYSTQSMLGCCELAVRNTAATTTQEECHDHTEGVGRWREDSRCSQRPSGQNSVAHNLKPCCYNIHGDCRLMSHDHCTFLGGHFHVNGPEHCSQVNCLDSICGIETLEQDSDHPWLPANPNQWWRLLISPFFHYGIIHTVLVCAVFFLLYRRLERSLGWLRVLLFTSVTNIVGNLVAAVFSPHQPQVGSNAAISGGVGLILVELIYFWPMIEKPALELAKLTIIIMFLLLSGTLPFLSNFSIVCGLLLGVMCAFTLLPFVSLRRSHKRLRRFCVIVSVLLLLIMVIVMFYLFYKVQTLQGCSVCNLLTCVPYTENMCRRELWEN